MQGLIYRDTNSSSSTGAGAGSGGGEGADNFEADGDTSTADKNETLPRLEKVKSSHASSEQQFEEWRRARQEGGAEATATLTEQLEALRGQVSEEQADLNALQAEVQEEEHCRTLEGLKAQYQELSQLIEEERGSMPPNPDDGTTMYKMWKTLDRDWIHVFFVFLTVVCIFVRSDESVSNSSAGAISVGDIFLILQYIASTFFLLEYLVRLYVCEKDPKFLGPYPPNTYAKWSGDNWHKWKDWPRVCYATDFVGVVDLLAWLPFFISMACAADSDWRVGIGAVQVAVVLKLDRKLPAFTLLDDMLSSNDDDAEDAQPMSRMLLCTAIMAMMLWVVFASLLWLTEKDRPEMDGSFATVPISLFHTWIFLGGEWDRVDLMVPWGELVGVCIAVAGIGIVGIPMATFFEGYQDTAKKYFEDAGLDEADDEAD